MKITLVKLAIYAVLAIIVLTVAFIVLKHWVWPILATVLAALGVMKTKVPDPIPPKVRAKEQKAAQRIEEIKQEVKADQATEDALDSRLERLKKRQKERTGNNGKKA
jgi:1,4-dihydroxy-2-naphthoate octaprenyltransferase